MSLLNKMLVDLDARQRDAQAQTPVVDDLRPAPETPSRHWLRYTALALVLLGGAGLIHWWPRPHSPGTAPRPRLVALPNTTPPAIAPALTAAAPSPVAPVQAPPAVLAPAGGVPGPEVPVESAGRPAAITATVRPTHRHRAGHPAARASAPIVPQQEIAASPSVGVERTAVPLSPEAQSTQDYLQAALALEQGRNPEATALLQQSLQLNPRNAKSRDLLATLELQAGSSAAARALLTAGLSILPDHARFPELLAQMDLDQGDRAGALAMLRAHRATAGHDADYLGFLAALEVQAGERQAAISDYRAALRLAPGRGVYWAGLAVALGNSDPEEAASAYGKALADPTLAPALRTYLTAERQALLSH